MVTRIPASIRYKNPGAMWGNALAIKWGAARQAVTLNDGKGQGNNIAVFPSYVAGICAQLDLWRTSKNYRNKRFADAIAVWSGHNEVPSYIAFCKKRVPGLTEKTVMNDAFWQSPSGIAFLKAQAWHEAGQPYPAPDADWIEAQRRVFAADPPAKPQPLVGQAVAAATVGTVSAAATTGVHQGWGWEAWAIGALIVLALAAIGGGLLWWWRKRKAAAPAAAAEAQARYDAFALPPAQASGSKERAAPAAPVKAKPAAKRKAAARRRKPVTKKVA